MEKEKNSRYERERSTNETKRRGANLVPMNFLKATLFRVHRCFLRRYRRESTRSTNGARAFPSIWTEQRNHDSPGTDLTHCGHKQKATGPTIFSRHKSGAEGEERFPITSVQVVPRTKDGEKKETKDVESSKKFRSASWRERISQVRKQGRGGEGREGGEGKRGKDRWKALISKLYAVLIRISVETVAGRPAAPRNMTLFFVWRRLICATWWKSSGMGRTANSL